MDGRTTAVVLEASEARQLVELGLRLGRLPWMGRAPRVVQVAAQESIARYLAQLPDLGKLPLNGEWTLSARQLRLAQHELLTIVAAGCPTHEVRWALDVIERSLQAELPGLGGR